MNFKDLPMDTEFDFKYYKHEEMRSFLENIQKQYPNLVKIEEIGKTYEGRSIWVAKITNFEQSDKEKSAYYVEANIHAGEVSGSTNSLYIIHYLANYYGKEKIITDLLDKFAFYVVPRISADGSEKYLTTPHGLRSSTRFWPYPDKLPGFHREDINNDGEILLMRVKDELGDWKISDKDPRLMLKRGAADFGDGPFYRMFPEGMLHEWNKGDPILLAPSTEGLDLNRNNPSGPWAQEFTQQGAGPFPLSEPETRAIADFFREHTNIAGLQSFHTFTGVILRPLSFAEDSLMETHDLEVFKKLGEIGEDLTGYPCININKEFKYDPKKDLLGGFLDWIFEHKGIFSFSTELWDMIKEAGIEKRDYIKFLMFERTEEEELKLLKWNDDVLGGEGFTNWHEFEHPQIGKVEIGGWKFKYTWQNPPLGKGYLEKICHNNALFAFAHASVNPRIVFGDPNVEKLSENNHKISISLLNTGFLPTYVSKQALLRKVILDGKLEILLENCELMSPKKFKVKIPHLEGRSNKLNNNMFFQFSPEDQKWTYEFIVKGDNGAKITLKAKTERAGTAHQTISI